MTTFHLSRKLPKVLRARKGFFRVGNLGKDNLKKQLIQYQDFEIFDVNAEKK
jgi:hypothetical protein